MLILKMRQPEKKMSVGFDLISSLEAWMEGHTLYLVLENGAAGGDRNRPVAKLYLSINGT